jgi:hypothetical protein
LVRIQKGGKGMKKKPLVMRRREQVLTRMQKMKKRACKDCGYCESHFGVGHVKFYFCRKNPPAFDAGRWPEISADDWCGEYKGKPKKGSK